MKSRRVRIRDSRLKLHKTSWIPSARLMNKTFGKIPSSISVRSGHEDPVRVAASACRHLSRFVDEASDEKTVVTDEKKQTHCEESSTALLGAANQEDWPAPLFDPWQRAPDLVFAHADAAKLFASKKSFRVTPARYFATVARRSVCVLPVT